MCEKLPAYWRKLLVYVLNQLVLPSERSKPVLVLLAVRHRCAFEGLARG
jgi:hypothetical protein